MTVFRLFWVLHTPPSQKKNSQQKNCLEKYEIFKKKRRTILTKPNQAKPGKNKFEFFNFFMPFCNCILFGASAQETKQKQKLEFVLGLGKKFCWLLKTQFFKRKDLRKKTKNKLKQKTPVFSPNSRNYLVDDSHIKKIKKEQKERQAIEAAEPKIFSMTYSH